MSISRLFDRSGGDYYVSRRRGSYNIDIRRDREEGQKHRGVGIVGGNGQGRQSRDEWDSVVILSIGRRRARRIRGSSSQFDGFVDILTVAYVSRNVKMNKPRINR